MNEDLRIDSHKLIYHPCRVSDWIRGQNIYPIEMEISPSGACNHRCIFCAVDYMGYQSVQLDEKVLLKNLKELFLKGLKSIVYAGEGEPLLNKNIVDIIIETKKIGIDVAMSSNGVLFHSEVAKKILPYLTWIRFSIASIREETYKKIHNAHKGDLIKVINNLKNAVEIKHRNKLSVTLGVQLLLLEENKDEVLEMAKILKDIGLDYFTIKPFYQHPKSMKSWKIDYKEFENLEKEMKLLENENYRIILRNNFLKKKYSERNYNKCYALPFMAHLDAKGNLWPCLVLMGEEKFCYGNIYEQSFVEIWEGEKRKEILKKIEKLGLTDECKTLFCRSDSINRYLSKLKNPQGHINFI